MNFLREIGRKFKETMFPPAPIKTEAWYAGREAYHDGCSTEMCPYINSKEQDDWLRGFYGFDPRDD